MSLNFFSQVFSSPAVWNEEDLYEERTVEFIKDRSKTLQTLMSLIPHTTMPVTHHHPAFVQLKNFVSLNLHQVDHLYEVALKALQYVPENSDAEEKEKINQIVVDIDNLRKLIDNGKHVVHSVEGKVWQKRKIYTTLGVSLSGTVTGLSYLVYINCPEWLANHWDKITWSLITVGTGTYGAYLYYNRAKEQRKIEDEYNTALTKAEQLMQRQTLRPRS